jgi:hypothetical protein
LVINIGKTKAMFVNCFAKMKIYGKEIGTVNEFKYLGIIIANNITTPSRILKARLSSAKRSFNAVCTNCKLLGISNVRIKLSLLTALVSSILLYGNILYACMSDVSTTLTPKNKFFGDIEIF